MDVPDELVGARVALRYRLGVRDGRPLYSDAVGELRADGTAALLVQTRRGPVRVERAAVVAVRAVPPAPPRRSSLAAIVRLEGLCADAWPAVVDRPLGGWRLRAAGGWTGRANSALAIGDPGRPVAGALDVVLAFAEEHGIRPRVQAPIGSPWDRAVAGQGWVLDAGHVAGAEVAVLVADLDRLVGRGPAVSVELPEHPDEAWWELAAGSPDPAQRSVVDPPGLRTAFGLVREPEGAAAGVMRATVVEDHLHLSLLEVVAGARRRGVATGLLAATAQWGRERGARWAVLQVALRNSDARALYDRHGFVEHHRYRYLVPDE